MANYRLIIGHTLKFEGGVSADPNDNALKAGHSGVLGKDGGDKRFPNNYIHTNKGVIWATYLGYCRKVGKTPTAKEFIAMPKALWEDIMKKLFWDDVKGDQIKSQAVAEYLFEAVWGSGTGGRKNMVIDLQRFLRTKGYDISVDGVIGNNTLTALNGYINSQAREREVIDELYKSREEFYRSLGSGYYNAWMGRLKALTQRSYELIEQNKYAIGGGLAVFLIVGGIAYYYLKNKNIAI